MTYELEVTPAREVTYLRGGFAFVIREGDRVACSGRIKPSGATHFDGAGRFPTAEVAARMAFVADLYADSGEMPEDFTFTDADDVEE